MSANEFENHANRLAIMLYNVTSNVTMLVGSIVSIIHFNNTLMKEPEGQPHYVASLSLSLSSLPCVL